MNPTTQNPSIPAPPASAVATFQTLDRTASFPYAPGEYARRALWQVVQALFIRPSPPRAYSWRRWWLRLFGAQMGTSAAIHSTTRIVHPWLLSMGDWSNISHGVIVYNLGPVRLGNHSVISQDAYLCAGTHDYTQPTLPLLRQPITIGNGVWIAAGAFIGPNVTIGDNSVIGARAVVMRDVPAGVLAAGNPCAVIKPRPMTGTGPAMG
jgi:putative colanic acid biosynthesis acetyltransferase WcaF